MPARAQLFLTTAYESAVTSIKYKLRKNVLKSKKELKSYATKYSVNAKKSQKKNKRNIEKK